MLSIVNKPEELFVRYEDVMISRVEAARTILRAELAPGLTVEKASYALTKWLSPDEIPSVFERTEGRAALLQAGLRYVDLGTDEPAYLELMDEQRFVKAFPAMKEFLAVFKTIEGIQPYTKNPLREKERSAPTLTVHLGSSGSVKP